MNTNTRFQSNSRRLVLAIATLVCFNGSLAQADPCGMVPPIYTGAGSAISRSGLQQTYVFFDRGVETFHCKRARRH